MLPTSYLCSLVADLRSTLRTLLLPNLCLLRLALPYHLVIVLLFGFSLRTRVFLLPVLTILITLFYISIILVVHLLVLPACQLVPTFALRLGGWAGAYLVKVLQDLLVRLPPCHLIPILILIVVLVLIVIAVLLLVLVVKLFIV